MHAGRIMIITVGLYLLCAPGTTWHCIFWLILLLPKQPNLALLGRPPAVCWPSPATLAGAVTPGPDAVIQIGEYIASDWTVLTLAQHQCSQLFIGIPALFVCPEMLILVPGPACTL